MLELIISLVLCIIALLLIYFVFSINFKEIKKCVHNKKLDEIVGRFPKNEEICKSILKILGNEKVKIKQDDEDNKEDEKVNKKDKDNDKASLYVAITDTIYIADIKDMYTRVQTIAHECIHSIQDRKMLLFNFFFTNVYLLYFLISTIFTIARVFTNYNLNIIILLILGIIYYVQRSYLEMDAMIKAKYLAQDYMLDFIKENPICSKEEVEEVINEYDRINKKGIPMYNFLLLKNVIEKVIIYVIVAIIIKNV